MNWTGQVVSRRGSVSFADVRVLWNRRAGLPTLPAGIAAQDQDYALKLSRTFLDSLRCLEGGGRTWVNPRGCQVRVDSKLEQLRVARRLGLQTPCTIVSNSPKEIKAFITSHPGAVMKPLVGHGWTMTNARVASSTVPAPNPDALASLSFQACPMIFQSRVEKAYELRVVFYGDFLLPVRLLTQALPDTSLDWRFGNLSRLDPEVISLPPGLRAKLIAFRREFGLLHGSFDLAVDKAGEAVFFEINEQGQTLWLEELNTAIPALDLLVAFLSEPSDGFAWSGERRF